MKNVAVILVFVLVVGCAHKPKYVFRCDLEKYYIVNTPRALWESEEFQSIFDKSLNKDIYEDAKEGYLEAKRKIEISESLENWDDLPKEEQREYASQALKAAPDVSFLTTLLQAFEGNIWPHLYKHFELIDVEYQYAIGIVAGKNKGRILRGDPQGQYGSCGYKDLTSQVFGMVLENIKEKLLTRPSKRPLAAALERRR